MSPVREHWAILFIALIRDLKAGAGHPERVARAKGRRGGVAKIFRQSEKLFVTKSLSAHYFAPLALLRELRSAQHYITSSLILKKAK
jgi:hypothetical protein